MEVIEQDKQFKASLGKEVVVDHTTLKPSLYTEVKREVEKYEYSSN